MDVADFDLDRSVIRAWSGFRRRLADLIDGLGADDVLMVEASSAVADADDERGCAPFVQVVATGETLHAELSSNAFLAPAVQLSDAMTAELVRVGWGAPDAENEPSPNFSIDVEHSESDRLAAMAVCGFRDVWGVPHPTFLEAGENNEALGITRDPPADTAGARTVHADRAQIQRQVDATLTEYLGEPPHKDGDGDIPVRSGSALVFIRVLPDHPLIELKAPLVVDISGRTRAAEVIADLNATWRQAKFVLVRDVVVLLLELPTTPFVPQHLVEALRLISRLADDLDDELAGRLGGRIPFDEQPGQAPFDLIRSDAGDDAELPPALVSLLHLAGPGTDLSTAEVITVCGDDRETILDLMRRCTEQEISWRRSGDEARLAGDPTGAASFDSEADIWQGTVELLRAALRELLTRRGS